jgi:Rod binding domain-containing protein
MNLSALRQVQIDASKLPLDSLEANKHIPEKDKIAAVSRDFEAVLLSQILQETQRPVFKSTFVTNSATDGIYRSLVVNQLAMDIAKSGSFGLAKSLARELQQQSGAVQAAPTTHSHAGQPVRDTTPS